ncbi:MAG: ABC transporter ATP-binding protein [Myxococcales bacterium]|nr:ABC transporter ATP-binding protein [Myxococcales bacterium]
MASVQLTDVHKAYGATQVVKGVSLSIASGELVALLGPSGCGKTTTLRMVAGLERVDRGVICIDGQEVDGPKGSTPPERRGLGMVFQSYAVWPNRTVAQNVAYPLTLQRVARSEVERRVAEGLSWVRLSALGDRLPQQLSGGQLQRVAIARALVANPKVLLLDEPLSNLDAALREELRGEIAALRARLGTTMIFVTHDQGEALALADRVAVMSRGVIEQVGRPDVVYREPATPYVASFVGGANQLDGVVEGGCFVCAGVRFPLPAGSDSAEGPATLVVRPEDLHVGGDGPALPLSARLFLGSATEYRFLLGDRVLRAVGPPRDDATPSSRLPLRLGRIRLYPPAA